MNEPRLTRRRFLRTTLGIGLAGGALAVGGGQYITSWEPVWIQIERVSLPIPDLADGLVGMRLVQISDIHLYPYTTEELVARAVERINGLSPDLVLMTGDYVTDSIGAIEGLIPILSRLNPRLGSFASLGNHDGWVNRYRVTEGLTRAGVRVLANEGLSLAHNGAALYVAGLDDGWTGNPSLNRALEAMDRSQPVVLLMHEPDFADLYAGDGRVSLQLSGHSHGGQVRLPGVGAPVLPWMASKYDQGLYQVGRMWLYTNRGLGMTGIPVRFNCRPEVTLFTLERA